MESRIYAASSSMDVPYDIVLSGTKENILDLFKYSVNYIYFLRGIHMLDQFTVVHKYGFYLLESTDMGNKEAMDGWLQSILCQLNTKQLIAILVGFFDEVTGIFDDRWEFTIGDVYPDTAEIPPEMLNSQTAGILNYITEIVSRSNGPKGKVPYDVFLKFKTSVTCNCGEEVAGQVENLAEAIEKISLDE